MEAGQGRKGVNDPGRAPSGQPPAHKLLISSKIFLGLTIAFRLHHESCDASRETVTCLVNVYG